MSTTQSRLRIAVDHLQEQAKDPNALDMVLQRAGLTRGDLEQPADEKTILADARFVREASGYLEDQTFGAAAGIRFRDASSLTAYITKHSRTLATAIQNSSRYHSLVNPAIDFSLTMTETSAFFELEFVDTRLWRYHRYAEFILFAGLARMRHLVGVDFFPVGMCFKHPSKGIARDLERLAGCPIEFEAETMGLQLSRATTELPIPTYDPQLRDHLMQYGDRLLKERPNTNPDLRMKVEKILVNALPGRIVSADEVASTLGMSRRTFARRLTDEGISYREVVDDLRGDLAKTYLKGGFSISEIAFLLDYADQAAFSTAFKRWTGQNPSQFRDAIGIATRH